MLDTIASGDTLNSGWRTKFNANVALLNDLLYGYEASFTQDDLTANAITIIHGLNTYTPNVKLYDGSGMLDPFISTLLDASSQTQIVITFPSAITDTYRIKITK